MANNKKTFIVQMKYWEPVEGTTYITADSEEEARSKAMSLFDRHKDVEIAFIDESPMSQMELDFGALLGGQTSAIAGTPEAFLGGELGATKKEDLN